MDKKEKENLKNKLSAEIETKISFLKQQIENLTLEYNASIKPIQEQIDSLTLQTEALTNFKIK